MFGKPTDGLVDLAEKGCTIICQTLKNSSLPLLEFLKTNCNPNVKKIRVNVEPIINFLRTQSLMVRSEVVDKYTEFRSHCFMLLAARTCLMESFTGS